MTFSIMLVFFLAVLPLVFLLEQGQLQPCQDR